MFAYKKHVTYRRNIWFQSNFKRFVLTTFERYFNVYFISIEYALFPSLVVAPLKICFSIYYKPLRYTQQITAHENYNIGKI